MDFLQYIEHDAENLQFYLWYRDYVNRFSQLPERQQRLAPEWTAEQAQAEKFSEKEKTSKKVPVEVAAVLKGTDFDPHTKVQMPDAQPNPFYTPPRTPSGDRESMVPSTVGWSENGSTMNSGNPDHERKAAEAFSEVDALQPCTSLEQHRNDPMLTRYSHHSTIQRGNLSHYRSLHC